VVSTQRCIIITVIGRRLKQERAPHQSSMHDCQHVDPGTRGACNRTKAGFNQMITLLLVLHLWFQDYHLVTHQCTLLCRTPWLDQPTSVTARTTNVFDLMRIPSPLAHLCTRSLLCRLPSIMVPKSLYWAGCAKERLSGTHQRRLIPGLNRIPYTQVCGCWRFSR
jgi:hypothetical protein